MSIDALQEKIRKLKNPTMLCLCPTYEHIPAHIRKAAQEAHGETLAAAAEAYRTFCFEILDTMQELIPAVSVELGCFSPLGADGIAAMQQVMQRAKELGYYVLFDMMRADLPPAVDDLASACFGEIKIGENAFTPYACDGVMLSGYLGGDGVLPFTKYCAEGKNVFLVAHSSNKSAREVQDLLSGDRVVYQVMADLAMRWSQKLFGRYGYSEIGIAAGLPNAEVMRMLRQTYDRLFLLVPGFGTQGGAAKHTEYAFDRMGHGACIMAGRSILYAYEKKESDGSDYLEHALAAAQKMRDTLRVYTTVL